MLVLQELIITFAYKFCNSKYCLCCYKMLNLCMLKIDVAGCCMSLNGCVASVHTKVMIKDIQVNKWWIIY